MFLDISIMYNIYFMFFIMLKLLASVLYWITFSKYIQNCILYWKLKQLTVTI